MSAVIKWDEVTPRPMGGGNYVLYHYGEVEFMDKTYSFTLVEMHTGVNDWTDHEVTWVDGVPDGNVIYPTEKFVMELENDIINSKESHEDYKGK